MRPRCGLFILALAGLALSAPLRAQCPQTEVPIWYTPQADAYHGTAVDLRGDLAVVGAPGWRSQPTNLTVGMVSVARWTGPFQGWVSQSLTKPAALGADTGFGSAVALNEAADVLVVGSPMADGVGFNRGRITIYEWDPGPGAFVPVYDGWGYHDNGKLGTSVDASGDRVVAGEPGAYGYGGALHIYERTAPGVWLDKGAITFSGTSQFGHSVAASGQRIVAGGPYKDLGSWTDAGEVMAFAWNGAQWILVADIVSEYDHALFGWSVDLWGDSLAVGFPFRASNNGGGRIYVWNGTTFALNHSSATLAVDWLTGWDVAVSGERGAFGSPGYDDGALGVVGGCRLLLDAEGAKSHWKQVRYEDFGCASPEAWAWYGAAVAMDGERMIVGAPYATASSLPLAGRAFVIDLQGSVGVVDRGHGLAGHAGVEPQLLAYSDPCMENDLYPVVRDARPLAPAHAVVGMSELALPFKGGVMVPSPDLIVSPLPTNTSGELSLNAALPPALPAYSFYMQVWITDSDGPVGFAASNGLRLDVPDF